MAQHGQQLAAGMVLVRPGPPWRYLLLRAYRNWDFPKGRVEPGETPLAAALREVAEETGIRSPDLRWGEQCTDTEPYSGGKVARYYLGLTHTEHIVLPVSAELGRPEHHEWRWVEAAGARALLPARLAPILAWAEAIIARPSAGPADTSRV